MVSSVFTSQTFLGVQENSFENDLHFLGGVQNSLTNHNIFKTEMEFIDFAWYLQGIIPQMTRFSRAKRVFKKMLKAMPLGGKLYK